MTARVHVLTLLAVASSILAVGAAPASACSCAPTSVAELLDGADVAFIGRAVATDAPTTGDKDGFVSAERTYVFGVDQVVKGDIGPSIEIVTPQGGGNCGATFPLERSSAVIAHQIGGTWTTSLCMDMGVTQLLRAGDGEPRPPSEGGEATVAADQDGLGGRLAGLLVLGAITVGSLWLVRGLRARSRATADRAR